MASPPFPRSLSDPHLSTTHRPQLLHRSTRSEIAPAAWPKKVSNYIAKKTSPKSKNTGLTKEKLEEHDRKLEILDERRYSTSSPYYRGLTDFSLVINRERLLVSSPGRENFHGVAAATSSIGSSSKSSFIVKVQEWSSSCFVFKNRAAEEEKTLRNNSNSNNNERVVLAQKEKPLRERESEQPLLPPQVQLPEQLPLPPPAAKTVKRVENEIEFLWSDKYRPDALKDFICNREKALELQNLVKEHNCGNFIFEGPPGVGKRTMIWAFLREAFGADKVQAREECKEFKLLGEEVASIEVSIKISSQHIEVNLTELKGYEKHVIAELIKESTNRPSNKGADCNHENCQAVILHEAEKLSTDALLYIRWLLEKYKGCNKVFFCCTDISKIQPVIPLCTIVQLLPPSKEEIVKVLEFIANQEGIELPRQLAVTIADNAKNNLRQAIRSFEATWKFNPILKEDQVIRTGWEDDIANIARNIVEEQSPKQLYIIRGKLQNLIEHSVSPEFIFKTLKEELKKNVDKSLHQEVQNLYDDFNRDDNCENPFTFARNRQEQVRRHNDPVRKNVQHFMKIEEFIAKSMSWYKSTVVNSRGILHERAI